MKKVILISLLVLFGCEESKLKLTYAYKRDIYGEDTFTAIHTTEIDKCKELKEVRTPSITTDKDGQLISHSES